MAGLGLGSLMFLGSSALSGCAGQPETVTLDGSLVPVGGGVIVGGYVVVQPTRGEFVGYDARCPHKGVKVGSVGETIHCPAHNADFELSTGNALTGPTDRPLTKVDITVAGEQLIIEPAK